MRTTPLSIIGNEVCGFFLGILILLTTHSPAHTAPQTFNTALPVAVDQFILRGQFVYRRASEDPTAQDRTIDLWGGAAIVGYGAARRLALFGVVPVLDKELSATLPDGTRTTRRASGIADARLFARYALIKRSGQGTTLRIAPFAGLEFPTGEDQESDSLGRLPPRLQLGSGSWDPFFGLIATYQTLQYQLDGQISYQANTKGDALEIGDVFRIDASGQYRIWPTELRHGVPGFLYLGLEANFLHQSRTRIEREADPNSGGDTFFVSPSLQYVTKRWVLETVVQLPLTQDLNGTGIEDDVVVRAGFRINF